MIGEIAMYALVILILTGVYLTFFFVPDSRQVVYDGSYAPLKGVHMSAAYESTLRVSFDVRAGLVMRQIHHWAALLFLGAILVHLLRIFFTGAFRRPREINWVIGLSLLLLGLANGFTGYSLPDDLLSGTGLRIAYSVLESIPLLGPWLAFLVFGGEFPSDDIISRLFVIHVLIVPALIVGLLTAHLALLVRHKHTQFAGRGRTNRNVVGSKLWPTFTAKTLGLFFFVFAVCAALGGLAQINPVWLYGPFQSSAVSAGSQPDWYIGWLEGALRLMPPWETRIGGFEVANPFFPGVLLPGITFMLLYAWPWIEARFTRDYEEHHLLDRPRDRPGPLRTRRVGHGVLRRAVLRRWQRRHRRALRPVGELRDLRLPRVAVRVARRLGIRHVPALQGALGARPLGSRPARRALPHGRGRLRGRGGGALAVAVMRRFPGEVLPPGLQDPADEGDGQRAGADEHQPRAEREPARGDGTTESDREGPDRLGGERVDRARPLGQRRVRVVLGPCRGTAREQQDGATRDHAHPRAGREHHRACVLVRREPVDDPDQHEERGDAEKDPGFGLHHRSTLPP